MTTKTSLCAAALAAIVCCCLALPFALRAQDQSSPPPKTWIDPDTGHRVIRLSDVPGSDSFYFNVNGYTPDGKEMAFITPGGISVLNLETLQERALITGVEGLSTIVVGAKTPTIYYTRPTDDPLYRTLWAANMDTGEIRQIAKLPRRANVTAINSDETLGAGDFIEGDAGVTRGTPNRMSQTNLGEPADKDVMMTKRLEAKLPESIFTINLQTGEIKYLIQHSTAWMNHEQFCPSDPTLLMYAHEGHWEKVDRIWTIRTDGTQNQLIHKRTLKMETDGHEWWSGDGKTIWYQLRFPQGPNAVPTSGIIPDRTLPGATYVAGYNVQTGERIWYHYNPDATSIHHNSSRDGSLFVGDGHVKNPWIMLCRPIAIRDDQTLGTNLINTGYFETERLVHLTKHNYRLEPNPSFTPDMKYVVFRSNMFGPDYPFAVEVAKAQP
jgi:oligogalacturonide lyase